MHMREKKIVFHTRLSPRHISMKDELIDILPRVPTRRKYGKPQSRPVSGAEVVEIAIETLYKSARK